MDDGSDHLLMLGMGERGRLAGRAARHQAVDAALDLEFDQLAQRVLVDLAVAETGLLKPSVLH